MLALPSAYMGTYMEERFWMHYTLEPQRAGVAEVLQDFNRKVWNQTKPNHLNLFFFPHPKSSAVRSLSLKVDSMRPGRQKMLSFAACVTSRANSIKIPSEEERWNCVMVVGALNLVMILSRGKWSCGANIMINSWRSQRYLFPRLPPALPLLLSVLGIFRYYS